MPHLVIAPSKWDTTTPLGVEVSTYVIPSKCQLETGTSEIWLRLFPATPMRR